MVQNCLSDVKTKKDRGPVMVDLKKLVSEKAIEAFSRGEIMSFNTKIDCVPNVDDLRNQILMKAHSSRYSIHLGATKIYCDLWEVY
ncbi:hypothetical protein MTR67_043108 [Solanum verrucosum]|uniref:Uncharacterized protein n=1 Tax=Solanum verrucosum TaxID=315347 RepID=A0AAF0UQP1_SOLVR|nr:hypothetical protein MTR67_043108 [Solanum verrucosum]